MRLVLPSGAAEGTLAATEAFLSALGIVVAVELDLEAPTLLKNAGSLA